MKKWQLILIFFAVVFILAVIMYKSGCIKTMSSDKLKSSIEIVNVETKWVKKFYLPWPPKLILVPSISFQVKNTSDKPLQYVNFNAVFSSRTERANLGDNFLVAIRDKPLLPGETSDVIELKSNYGVEGKTINSFKTSPDWKAYIVKLFAQSKGSQYVLVGEWVVSRKIDFVEPGPLGIEEKREPVQSP